MQKGRLGMYGTCAFNGHGPLMQVGFFMRNNLDEVIIASYTLYEQ